MKLCDLCQARVEDTTPPTDTTEREFFNLAHELVRLMGANELFTFVRVAGHQQRVGTDSANPGEEPPYRSNHSQRSRCSPPHDPDQRTGIAADAAAGVRLPVGAGGSQPLVSDRRELLRPDPEKTGAAPADRLPARRAGAAPAGQLVLGPRAATDGKRRQFPEPARESDGFRRCDLAATTRFRGTHRLLRRITPLQLLDNCQLAARFMLRTPKNTSVQWTARSSRPEQPSPP